MNNLPREIVDKNNNVDCDELLIYIIAKYNIDLENIHNINKLNYDVLINYIINKYKINLENEKLEYINEELYKLNNVKNTLNLVELD